MRKKAGFYIIILLIAAFAANCAYAAPAKKKVVAVAEEMPNYIFHVLAVSRVGFDSNYANIYKDTVVSEDKEYLKKHEYLLTFKEGKSGDLVDIVIFFPAYVDLKSIDDLKEYYTLLDNGFKANDFSGFLEKYSAYVNNLKKWPPHEKIDNEYLKEFSRYRGVIDEIGQIYIRNFDVYEGRLWRVEKNKIEQKGTLINDYLKYKDLITKWEALTGREFKFDTYYIMLTRSIKGGPNANSLGYDKNIFWSDASVEFTNKFISHEVGTHILIDDYYNLVKSGNFNFEKLYKAYENLSSFYNSIILENPYLSYMPDSYCYEDYYAVYNELYAQNKNITPVELLTLGMKKFTDLQIQKEAQKQEEEAKKREEAKKIKGSKKINKK